MPAAGANYDTPHWLSFRQRGYSSGDILEALAVKRPPVPVLRIARDMGVDVEFVSRPGWMGAVESDLETRTATVWVDAALPSPVRRFTVAHELGHLLLHEPGKAFRDLSVGDWKEPKEREADNFAAALLMPRVLLTPLIYHSRASVEELAELFEVSRSAMAIRIDRIRKGKLDR